MKILFTDCENDLAKAQVIDDMFHDYVIIRLKDELEELNKELFDSNKDVNVVYFAELEEGLRKSRDFMTLLARASVVYKIETIKSMYDL